MPAIKSESKREEILRRRHSFLQKMLNDDGYYSIEHNPRKYGSKSDATTQTPYNYRDNGEFSSSSCLQVFIALNIVDGLKNNFFFQSRKSKGKKSVFSTILHLPD